MDDIKITTINNKIIVLYGIGKLFYQDGFPINMAISKLKENNIEVSILHIADELLKHGWSEETVLKKLRFELEDTINGDEKFIDFESLKTFIYSDYEQQRELIFQYLFNYSTDDVRNGKDLKSMEFLRLHLKE